MLGRSSLIQRNTGLVGKNQRVNRPTLRWWIAVVAFWLAFAMWPVSLGSKAHLFLGGLCAQRPNHSFTFGGQHLPFDARMTGIYLGSLVTLVLLAARHRTHGAGRFTLTTWFILTLFVTAMGIDGFNSFLLDIGRWHPYTPDNRLRLLTGFVTGISLGAVLLMLVASSVWKASARADEPPVSSREVLGLSLVSVPVAALVMTGDEWLYVPLTLLLVASAVVTVSSLGLVCVSLVKAPHGFASRWSEVNTEGSRAMLIAILAIVALGALRYVAERAVGPFDSV